MKELTREELQTLLLQFIGGMTLCDHMGDVSNDVSDVLKRLGLDIEWDEWSELGKALHRMGVTTLHGTELWSPEDEEDDEGNEDADEDADE